MADVDAVGWSDGPVVALAVSDGDGGAVVGTIRYVVVAPPRCRSVKPTPAELASATLALQLELALGKGASGRWGGSSVARHSPCRPGRTQRRIPAGW